MNTLYRNGLEVIQTLHNHGYEAYMVGGFVRDHILKLETDDIDITTSATPKEVALVFKKVKETGAKYGTVTVLYKESKFEVTTFRKDGHYIDSRRPLEVYFSKDINDDIKRRDFTINALLIDHNEKMLDLTNGVKDIENKIIKTIGNPMERFDEDALRMFRAFRFVSKLGFDIDKDTLSAITELKSSVKHIAIERVMVEISKIVKGKYRNKALKLMIDSGFADELYGLKKGMEFAVTFEDELNPIEFFIISFILDDIDEVWRFSNKEIYIIKKVLGLHEVTKEDEFNKLIVYVNKLEMCLLTNKINVLFGYKDQEENIRKMEKELPIKDVCDLVFKGQDILWNTDLQKKSLIGIIIDELKYNVIMGIMPNEYDVLKEYALKRVDDLLKEQE